MKMVKVEIKRLLGYFFYTTFIGYILYEGTKYSNHLDPINPITGKFEPYPYYIIVLGFPIVIGILIALPGFVNNFRERGKWYFDWAKFISVGLPTFFLTMYPIILISKVIPVKIPIEINFALGFPNNPHAISGVVFGYLLLSVFSKHEP